MRFPGIVGTLRLAGVVVLAIPPVLFGLERLLVGDPIGLVFVGLGGAMIVVERLVTDPFDPLDVGEAALDRLSGRTSDEEE